MHLSIALMSSFFVIVFWLYTPYWKTRTEGVQKEYIDYGKLKIVKQCQELYILLRTAHRPTTKELYTGQI